MGDYDTQGNLREREAAALASLVSRQLYGHFRGRVRHDLARLTKPILDVVAATGLPKQSGDGAIGALIAEMHARQSAYWVWPRETWLEVLSPSAQYFRKCYPWTITHARHALVTATYLFNLFDDFRALGLLDRTALACRIFGRQRIEASIKRVVDLIRSWGYGRFEAKDVQWALCTVLLANKSPNLMDLTIEVLKAERDQATVDYRGSSITVLSRALQHLGAINQALEPRHQHTRFGDLKNGVDAVWIEWAERWYNTCTIQPGTRRRHNVVLMKAGRWVTQVHPDYVSPDRWTRELAAEWVGLVCRMKSGDWTQVVDKYKQRAGQPLSAKARAHHLSSVSAFFRDIQEWGWIPRRFDPRRTFAAPRSLRALIGPKPKVIADDVWAKLLWAGINLEEGDLTRNHNGRHFYPLEMAKAVTVVWLFCGLRMDEIRRLRVGCTRDHLAGGLQAQPATGSATAICNLDVPVNKTSQAFTKPVDGIVAESIRA